MAKVDVLQEGYAYMTTEGGDVVATSGTSHRMRATGSCCLIRSNGITILFDTLGPWEKDKLLTELAKRSLMPSDIDYLVCSHSHPDHIGNINLFTEAKLHVIGTSVYEKDVYHLDKFEPIGSFKYLPRPDKETNVIDVIEYQSLELDSKVKIIPTIGHTMECVSVIVEDNELGEVGLVGDLFERQEDLKDDGIWLRAGSQNPDFQQANRAKIYNRVDYILPGHGPMFKADGTIK